MSTTAPKVTAWLLIVGLGCPLATAAGAPASAAVGTSDVRAAGRSGAEDSGRVIEAYVVVPGIDSDHDRAADRVYVKTTLPSKATAPVPAVIEASPYYRQPLKWTEPYDPHVDSLYVPGEPGTRPRPSRARTQPGDPSAQDGRSTEVPSLYGALFRKHGYASVVVHTLGTGRSTGCLTLNTRDEGRAVAAVAAWLNGRGRAYSPAGRPVRATWSNGRVGIVGVSYDGALANAGASYAGTDIDAVIDIAGPTEWYGYWRSQGMVRSHSYLNGQDAYPMVRALVTRDHPEACAAELKQVEEQQDRVTGDGNRFWAKRTVLDRAGRLTAPVLTLHGHNDDNVMSGQTGTWLRALDRAGVPHQAWWHERGHGDDVSSFTSAWKQKMLRWLDHWLRDEDNGVMDEPGSVLIRRKKSMITHSSWPAPEAEPVHFYPHGTGRGVGELSTTPGTGIGTVIDDPTKHGRAQLDEAGSSARLLWRGAPLAAPLRLSGFGSITLRAAFDAEAANVSVGLVVFRDGKDRYVSRGWIDPQNRRSPAVSRAVRPGRFATYRITLNQVFEHEIPAGARLGMVVFQSDADATLLPPGGTEMKLDLAGTRLTLPVVGE